MNEIVSLSQLARRLHVTQKWLREQADAGKIPCLKADSRYLFNLAAVQNALSERAANSRRGVNDGK